MIYQGLTIDLSRVRGSQGKTLCPHCKEIGKENYKDDCLSVNKDTQLFHCHKCGWSGYYGEVSKPAKQYTLPTVSNLTELKDAHLSKFIERGITQKTVIRNGIKSAKGDWYTFTYTEGQSVVNLKFRNAKKKAFMQAKDAKPTMYKYNDIVNQNEIIICEGEFDALSWEEAGFCNSTSVNQGAPNAQDKTIDKKLECVFNCFDIFEKAETIYLSVDQDENGTRLKNELVRIFTAEKCKIISLGKYKDANEALCLEGKEFLIKAKEDAKDVKVDGIFTANDYRNEIISNYKNGQPKGSTTHFTDLDVAWTHRPGEVTLWTGYNNEGKSLFLKQLLLIKAKLDNWNTAIFSPEEVPLNEFFTDLIESYVGLSADKSQEQYKNYMSFDQLEDSMNFIENHFYNVNPADSHTVEELLNKFSYTVRKYNVKSIVLDPYNQIHHKMNNGEREDLYISRFMATLKQFAVKHNVCVHLVAHQRTPLFQAGQNYPEPNLYTVKGGGTFSDKVDNVCVIWRENRNTDIKNTEVKFISQKIKKQKLTGIPSTVLFNYDRRSNRYTLNDYSPLVPKLNEEIKNSEFEFNNANVIETDSMPF